MVYVQVRDGRTNHGVQETFFVMILGLKSPSNRIISFFLREERKKIEKIWVNFLQKKYMVLMCLCVSQIPMGVLGRMRFCAGTDMFAVSGIVPSSAVKLFFLSCTSRSSPIPHHVTSAQNSTEKEKLRHCFKSVPRSGGEGT